MTFVNQGLVVCKLCGNKRCPHARNETWVCTRSNEPGQVGVVGPSEPMTTPTIHLNGTSKQELADGFELAYDALNAAYDAIKQTAPNGRDFYPQGEWVLSKAIGEHTSRLAQVELLMKEFEQLLEACDAVT